MASTDLVFGGLPLTTGDLVFGDDGSDPTSDAIVSGIVDVGMPTLQGAVALGIVASGAVDVGMPELSGEVKYFTDTARPLVATAAVRWQDAEPLYERAQQRFQDGAAAPLHVDDGYQDGVHLEVGAAARFQEALRTPRPLVSRFEDGVPLRTGARERFQEALRTPRSLTTRYQQGVKTPNGWQAKFNDGLRAPNRQRSRYQDAVPLHTAVGSTGGYALKLQRGWSNRYQEGIQPKPGRTILIPVIPPVDPCYTPSGDLVFEMPWSADTNLVFVCEKHVPPEPGATIVVPVKKAYIVLNTASLHRVDGNVPIPTYSMSMSLDVDSWTWSFSASLPGQALADISPDTDGNPALVEARLNGVAYRFLVTNRGRDRAFASDGLRISGKGISAELADPIAPAMSFGNTIDRTAQQLMGDVLTLNGVPLPWTIDWQLENWPVKANNWKKQGTYMDALTEIVAAAGGYLQPHPTDKTLHALLRYPTLPWDWGTVTPDYELPTAAVTNEGTDWAEKPVYDRVYVMGQGDGGRNVNVRRAGTAGELIAQPVVDPLITDTIAGRQRGGRILADTGKITTYTLRSAIGIKDTDGNPVGIIPPGKFIRYVDPDEGTERIGITRSVTVEVRMPEIWQTIQVETQEYV